MALSTQARVSAARSNTEFRNQVTGSLVKHAKYVSRSEMAAPQKSLAALVLNDADGWVYRFALAFLTEPGAGGWINDLDNVEDITDQQAQDTIAELFPLFVQG